MAQEQTESLGLQSVKMNGCRLATIRSELAAERRREGQLLAISTRPKVRKGIVEAGSDRAFEAWLGPIPCADSSSLHPCGQVAALPPHWICSW